MANRQVVVDIIGDAKKFTKATDDAVKASESMADKIKKAGSDVKKGFLEGIGIGGGLGVYDTVVKTVGAVVDAVGRSIDLASDKAEAASKANVLFGASYGIVEKASKTAATSVGLSSGAYLTAAGDLGNLITNMGITGNAAATMSVDMLQLASDMGSFNNASTQDVTEAMGAAFRGETEPIRRFGVMLSAAKVEAKALAMGLKDGKKPLSDQAKAMATYQLILEQTTAAQGDFARTADGKANADRIRAAKSEEAFTRLGEVLLPLYQTAMPLLADATTAAIDTFTNLAGAVAPLVNGALDAISAAIKTVGDSFTSLKELMDPSGTEWDKTTRAIMDQSKALGLNGEEVLAYTEALRARRKAEQDAARTAAQVAEQTKIMEDITANAHAEMDAYVEGMKGQATQEEISNYLLERKKQLSVQIEPYLTERNRLLGIQAQQQAAVNKVDTEEARIKGIASDAVDDYNKMIAQSNDLQIRLGQLIPTVTTSVTEQSSGFSKAASAINLGYGSVLLATVEAQEKAAKKLSPENPKGVAHAVENTIDAMFQSMEDAKGPWKAQWQQLAAWAKDPFRPEKFEEWVGSRVKQAMKKARQSFGSEKARWLEIANAYRFIAKNNWIDPMKADIEKIMFALRLASRITEAGKRTNAPSPNPGHRASGGPVTAGRPYIVGEAGREMFVPETNGRIVSNSAMGGNTTISIVVNTGVGDPVAIGGEVIKVLRAYTGRRGNSDLRVLVGR